MPRSLARLSASASSHHDLSLAVFITNIAESDFRYTQVMDRDREHLLCVILTYDIVVKNFAYLLGGRNAIARLRQRGLVLLADDVQPQCDAILEDKSGRT